MPGALQRVPIWKEGGLVTIGEKIKFHRKSRGLTLKALGEKAGFCNRGDVRIAQYENGSRIPKYENLKRIADALDVSVEDLAGAECRSCPYRRMMQQKKAVIHLEDDPGYEIEVKNHGEPDEEGFLYDNLD